MKNTKNIYNVTPVNYKPTEQRDFLIVDTKEKYEIKQGEFVSLRKE